jgi:hypothetical protein
LQTRLFIFAALEMESRAATRALAIPFKRDRKPTCLNAVSIEVHTIGMRAEFLPRLVQRLRPSPRDRCWMVGLAGALDPRLKVGDVVIDADPATALQLADATLRRGRIHTSRRLIGSPAEKQALFARTGALAVDMEQEIVKVALTPLGVSVIGIRAISDAANTSLDPALPNLVDPIGRPRYGALAAALLRRPNLLRSLIPLGRDTLLAAKRLTETLAYLLTHDI